MKRSAFFKIWIIIMFILSIVTTIDSLTYLSTILLTKNYLQFIGIIANFVQIWALVLLLQWKKLGITLLLCATIAGILVAAFDQPTVVTSTNQAFANIVAVLAFNLIVLGILYIALKPVWKKLK